MINKWIEKNKKCSPISPVSINDDEETDVPAPLPVTEVMKRIETRKDHALAEWECSSEVSFFGNSVLEGGTLELYEDQLMLDDDDMTYLQLPTKRSKSLVIWAGFQRTMTIKEEMKSLRLKGIEGLVAQRTGDWTSLSIKSAAIIAAPAQQRLNLNSTGFIDIGCASADLLSEISSNEDEPTSLDLKSTGSITKKISSSMDSVHTVSSVSASPIVTPPRKNVKNRQAQMRDRAYVSIVTFKKSIITVALQRGGAIFMVRTTLEKSSARMAHSWIDNYAQRAILIENAWLKDLVQKRNNSACLKKINLPEIVQHFRETFATKEPKEFKMPTEVVDARIIDAVIHGGPRGAASENLILFNNIHYTNVSVLVTDIEITISVKRTSSDSEGKESTSMISLLNELGLSHLADAHSSEKLFHGARVTSRDARLRRIVTAHVSAADCWQSVTSELLARWLVVLCAKSLRSSKVHQAQLKHEKAALSTKALKTLGSVRPDNDSLSVHDNCIDALLFTVTSDVLPCFHTKSADELYLRCLGSSTHFLTTDPYTTLAEIRKLDAQHPALTPNITAFGTSTFGPQQSINIASQTLVQNSHPGISEWN